MEKDKQISQFIKAPRGTEDILPDNWGLWRTVEKTAREIFELAGYYEIRTPIFEDTNLFIRSIGETTDIVEKEMYTFRDGETSSITLRPENTAPVMRAYVEYEVYKTKRFQKYYYIGPMFRKERPQAGRLRQFHQMGIEAVGTIDPLLDAETIIIATQIFNRLGLSDHKVKINSIGCKICRPGFRTVLKEELIKYEEKLCELCKARLNRNVFRVLDCKEERCKEITQLMPSIQKYLCDGCRADFSGLKDSISMAGINYNIEPHLVRGLDYYTKTVYEITHPSLGARDTICAGGRYDNLIEEIGGPSTGAVGFAAGIEATILAMKNSMTNMPKPFTSLDAPKPDIYVVSIGNESRKESFCIINKIRAAGLSADMDYEARSPKAQMRTANKLGVNRVIMIGPDEINKGVVKLKDMRTGNEDIIDNNKIVEFIKAIQGSGEKDQGAGTIR